MYYGLLIKESLRDESVMGHLTVTKEETWDVENATEGQPSVWHVAWFDIPDDKIEEITELLSNALNVGKWFLEISSSEMMFVVFPGKIFHYQKGDAMARSHAVEHGLSIGIPKDQLDWKE